MVRQYAYIYGRRQNKIFTITVEITTMAWRHSHTNPNPKYTFGSLIENTLLYLDKSCKTLTSYTLVHTHRRSSNCYLRSSHTRLSFAPPLFIAKLQLKYHRLETYQVNKNGQHLLPMESYIMYLVCSGVVPCSSWQFMNANGVMHFG